MKSAHLRTWLNKCDNELFIFESSTEFREVPWKIPGDPHNSKRCLITSNSFENCLRMREIPKRGFNFGPTNTSNAREKLSLTGGEIGGAVEGFFAYSPAANYRLQRRSLFTAGTAREAKRAPVKHKIVCEISESAKYEEWHDAKRQRASSASMKW